MKTGFIDMGWKSTIKEMANYKDRIQYLLDDLKNIQQEYNWVFENYYGSYWSALSKTYILNLIFLFVFGGQEVKRRLEAFKTKISLLGLKSTPPAIWKFEK